MTASAASWQLDRLSANAREAAEIASLGVGLSLSAWLTRLIGETCDAEGLAPANEPPKILEFTREIRERPAPVPAKPPSIPSEAAPPAPQASPPPPAAFRPTPVSPAPTAASSSPPSPASVTPLASVRPPPATPAHAAPQAAPQAPPAGAIMLPVTAIVAANLGTRRGEDVPESLLADIAARGVRQAITVRRAASSPDRFELICGHRRWRAAQRVGLTQIPARVVAKDDAAAMLASLADNLETGNLTVLEEAQAYLRLLTQCGMDASAVTAAVGRDRHHVVHSMRLLGLPPLVRHLVAAGMLSREHAYLLLDARDPEALADAILAENLTVEAARQRLAGTTRAEVKA